MAELNDRTAAVISQVYFEDVTVGSDIPPLVKGPFFVMDSMKFGAMMGDFYPTHYDHKWAAEKDKVPAVIVYGIKMAAHLCQVVTDWMGAGGVLKKYSNRLRSPTYIGETVTMHGKVVGLGGGDAYGTVELRLWGQKEDGTVVIEGAATVMLPFRGRPASQ